MRNSVFAIVTALVLVGAAAASEIDILTQKLIEKGVLDSGDAQQVLAETKDEVAKKLAIGSAENVPAWAQKITWSGYTQMSYTDDPTIVDGKEPLIIKRARIAMTVKLNDWATFKIQPDFASAQTPAALAATGTSKATALNKDFTVASTGTLSPVVAFKEIWIDLAADNDLATFRFGQYHQPFGFENPYSSSRKKVFDTPQYMTNVLTADYDFGIQWWGNLPGSLKNLLQWRAAISNGTTWGSETDNAKDYSIRLTSSPVPGLELGASMYNRWILASTLYSASVGLYVKYEEELAGIPTFFTAEFIGGKGSNGTTDVMDSVITLEMQPFGLLMPCLAGISPVIRVEQWDANVWDGKAVSYYTVGVNVYADKSVRFLADYRFTDNGLASTAASTGKLNCMLQVNY
ncbi:MAG: porin [Candidatus Firestonebacteria bacterium]|nr:porin [Candidatus Firestonebacteria bacterium]